jgi:hypothetical protein
LLLLVALDVLCCVVDCHVVLHLLLVLLHGWLWDLRLLDRLEWHCQLLSIGVSTLCCLLRCHLD